MVSYSHLSQSKVLAVNNRVWQCIASVCAVTAQAVLCNALFAGGSWYRQISVGLLSKVATARHVLRSISALLCSFVCERGEQRGIVVSAVSCATADQISTVIHVHARCNMQQSACNMQLRSPKPCRALRRIAQSALPARERVRTVVHA